VLLAVALVFKLPTLIRAWRDPDVRATTILLACATAVLVVVTPVNISRLNRWTGIPNLAAPTAYSFLTLFCAFGLTMIMRWSEPPSERRRRRIIVSYWIFAGIIAGLWATFLLADIPEPRIYDLDTYYASTPWMREHTLLYLLSHLVSCLVAASMLWKWFPEVNLPWLKTGVVFLQLGYATGLLFDAAKLTALTARWTGHNLDFFSTKVAPPFALLEAALVALGFLAPQVGPPLQKRSRDQIAYLRLRSLWRTVRVIEPAAATAHFGWRASLDLRLMQRRQRLYDALRLLAPYFNEAAYQRLYVAASTEYGEATARGFAGALAIQAAVEAYRNEDPYPYDTSDQPQIGPDVTDVTDHIDDIARALYRPRALDRIRQRVTTESHTHA
jgi:hypothetical protein